MRSELDNSVFAVGLKMMPVKKAISHDPAQSQIDTAYQNIQQIANIAKVDLTNRERQKHSSLLHKRISMKNGTKTNFWKQTGFNEMVLPGILPVKPQGKKQSQSAVKPQGKPATVLDLQQNGGGEAKSSSTFNLKTTHQQQMA